MRRCWRGFWVHAWVLVLLPGAQPAGAQDGGAAQPAGPALLEVPVRGDLSFHVRADRISAVSLHAYLVPPYEVLELVVDVLGGPSQIRVYAMTLLDGEALEAAVRGTAEGALPEAPALPRRELPGPVAELAERAGRAAEAGDAAVVKVYPGATHAHTVEYRLGSREAVRRLHGQLVAALVAHGNPGRDLNVIRVGGGARTP